MADFFSGLSYGDQLEAGLATHVAQNFQVVAHNKGAALLLPVAAAVSPGISPATSPRGRTGEPSSDEESPTEEELAFLYGACPGGRPLQTSGRLGDWSAEVDLGRYFKQTPKKAQPARHQRLATARQVPAAS